MAIVYKQVYNKAYAEFVGNALALTEGILEYAHVVAAEALYVHIFGAH